MSFRKVLFLLMFVSVLCCFHCLSLTNFLPYNNKSISTNSFEEEARKKKKDKYLLPILFGALVVKSIVFPLAFKAMAVMSSIAVLLSTMSLIISSIIGYAKIAHKPPPPSLKVIHVNEGNWEKEDGGKKGGFMPTMMTMDGMDYEQSAPQETIYYANK